MEEIFIQETGSAFEPEEQETASDRIDQKKRDKFIKTFEPKINRILSGISSLPINVNFATMRYQESDVKKMMEAIERELKTAEKKLLSNIPEETEAFTFD